MFIKKKIVLVGIYKYPIYIKYNRTMHYKKDYQERNLENELNSIGNKICVKKKQRTTNLLIQLNKHSN